MRERIVALKSVILSGGFLETHLQRVIARVSGEFRKTVEFAVELRIRPEQIQQRNGVVVVNRVGSLNFALGPVKRGWKGLGTSEDRSSLVYWLRTSVEMKLRLRVNPQLPQGRCVLRLAE